MDTKSSNDSPGSGGRNKKLTRSGYEFGFHDTPNYSFVAKPGLGKGVVEEISRQKTEPEWMKGFRVKALGYFEQRPMPTWGADLSEIDFGKISYYARPEGKTERTWDEVPEKIKNTFERIGVPEAERKYLAGVKGQYDSEVVYGSILKNLADKGVVFLSMDEGLRKYPELIKEYFGKIIPANDNKFAALNSAVWSGGSFVYVPKGVKVDLPLSAYFRINMANMGQFERTLIIAEEGSFVHYIEGCTASIYSTDSLHSAVVEIFVKKGARVRYTTIQNWSTNVYNLVTKRAKVEEEGVMEWVDGNFGCLTKTARLFVADQGYKYIHEIRPGDLVYSLDLDTLLPIRRRVLGVKKTGVRMSYRLVTENYREVEATDNHPFLALERQRFGRASRLVWKPLKELKQGDYVGLMRGSPDDGRIHTFAFQTTAERWRLKNKVDIPNKTSSPLLWLFGLFMGDGYIERGSSGRPNRVYFAVPKGDRAYAQLIREIPKVFGCGYKHKGICVTVNSVEVAEFFHSVNLGTSAKTKRIPRWVFSLPISQRLAFIKGYFDADGYLRKQLHKDGETYGQIVFASVNKDLLGDLKLLMISCGLNPLKISTYVKSRKLRLGITAKEYSSSYLSTNIRDSLGPIESGVTSPPRLEFARIREISAVGKQEVFDIEIGGSHNFIANGIVVHNSKITMKYPSCYLVGRGARGDILSVALAGAGQHQDAGGKVIHAAPYTSSSIISKSVSHSGGRTSYRGLVQVYPRAIGAKVKVRCDALILDEKSRSDTYPTMRIDDPNVSIEHEATVSKVGEEQLFYLMSRGLTQAEAEAMVVNGFIEPIARELPMEYAVELNRLINLEMEGAVG